MKKFSLVSLVFAAVVLASVPFVSQAYSDAEHSSEKTTRTAEAKDREQRTTDDKTRVIEQKREELEAKRAEIQQSIEAKRAQITEKLTDKRKELCDRKQGNINKIIDNRATAGERHLATFNKIRDRLVAFVAEKNLTVENGAALELIMNDKQAAAQAAVEATKAIDFTCKDADSTAPGGIVKDLISAQWQAMRDYRTAIKDYAAAAKSAASKTVETETSNE